MKVPCPLPTEAPSLAQTRAYTGHDADRARESNMIISVETTMKHPRRGFITLEDTVAVTDQGWLSINDFIGGFPVEWSRRAKSL